MNYSQSSISQHWAAFSQLHDKSNPNKELNQKERVVRNETETGKRISITILKEGIKLFSEPKRI